MTTSGLLGMLVQQWRLDALSGVFAGLTLAVSLAAAVYAPAYLRQERYRHESRARYWLVFALFVAGMLATVAAADLVRFLVCWEVMTLASYVLVAYETGDPAALRAAFKYFLMTHCGSACLVLAVILLWVEGGGLAFADLPATFTTLAATRPVLLHAILALLFAGFATKAGLYPFGDWLPAAHPAAPAPVSAVLSGVMIKIGLYGFFRFFVWELSAASPDAAAAWGYVLAAAGALSALVGGFAASAARDTKVLLAYSSIAQSGLIALGMGAGVVLLPAHPVLASLALLGALFHTAGDAFVKALLFFTAGSLQYRTGSRRLEDLGGLFQAMPVTGWTALIAALAVAGFPPLTAFTGKWLMLQGTVLARDALLVVLGLALLVASVLSILYALKYVGGTFATRTMRPGRLEVPASMAAPQVVLAAVLLAGGAFPGVWLGLLSRVLHALPGLATLPTSDWTAFVLGPVTGAYAPIVLVALAAWALVPALAALGRPRTARTVPVWEGGSAPGREPTPVSALGFYVPLRDGMHRAYAPVRFPRLHRPAWVVPLFDADRWLFRPVARSGRRAGAALQRAHSGVPHLYIVWQLVGAVALILVLLLRR